MPPSKSNDCCKSEFAQGAYTYRTALHGDRQNQAVLIFGLKARLATVGKEVNKPTSVPGSELPFAAVCLSSGFGPFSNLQVSLGACVNCWKNFLGRKYTVNRISRITQ